jgi:hypothetical protein
MRILVIFVQFKLKINQMVAVYRSLIRTTMSHKSTLGALTFKNVPAEDLDQAIQIEIQGRFARAFRNGFLCISCSNQTGFPPDEAATLEAFK